MNRDPRQTPHPQPALGKAVRELRTKRGTTQEDLAHEAGITPKTLSLIERGEANPTWGTLRGIAEALNVSMTDLAKLADKFLAAENETEMRHPRPGTPRNRLEGRGT